ncbi:MAG: dipeptidase [Chitinophagaceae bacterium]|nr:dipeptidase [Chitinophagaceae bacterium]
MKQILILLILLNIVFNSYGQQYRKLHMQSIVVDSHNDIITAAFEKGVSFDQDLKGITHSDLQRLAEGGIDVQVFSIWCDGLQKNPFAYANRQIDTLYAVAGRNTSKMAIIRTPDDLARAVSQHKLAAMIGVEGGHMIENDVEKLDSLFRRGARYMTLTWNNSTPWATSAMYETLDTLQLQPKGLSYAGKAIVRRMNKLGMMVDLSHVGEATFRDAIAETTKPVIVSHSCVYKLCPVFRNLKDDQILAVAKNKGVIQVNFFSLFLDSNYQQKNKTFLLAHTAERDSLLKLNPEPYFADNKLAEKYASEVDALKAPLSLLIDHIDYIVKLAGIDHVGLGSDFDGIPSPPQQLNDVTTMPLITKELLARGYNKKDIRKILGQNFIRVFTQNAATKN